jgi:purine-binding chemotaxis protein CheW
VPPTRADLDLAEVQRILDDRAAALARVDEEPTCANTVGLVLFRLGTEWYGARLEEVREIHTGLVATRLPRVPEHVLGVTSIRGEILSVTDPARLLGMHGSAVRHADRFESGIIVEAGGRASMLVVDEVGDIVDVPADTLETPLARDDAGSGAYVTASALVGDRVVAVVDVERMVQPLGTTP